MLPGAMKVVLRDEFAAVNQRPNKAQHTFITSFAGGDCQG